METIELSRELRERITQWKVFAPGTNWVRYYSVKSCKNPETALRRAQKEFPFPTEQNKLWVSGLTMHAETKPIAIH